MNTPLLDLEASLGILLKMVMKGGWRMVFVRNRNGVLIRMTMVGDNRLFCPEAAIFREKGARMPPSNPAHCWVQIIADEIGQDPWIALMIAHAADARSTYRETQSVRNRLFGLGQVQPGGPFEIFAPT